MKQMVTTAKIQISVDMDSKILLDETISAYSAACNYVSDYVFRTHDLKQFSLNKALYSILREKFSLKSQMAQSVLKTVIARYKTILENQKKWIKPCFKRPQYDLVWNRDYSLARNCFSVNTLKGRIKLPYFAKGMSKYFDHTILKAEATETQVAKICDEALANDFASVCVNQYYTRFVAEKLKGSDVKVCTVVGFPLGMSDTGVKAFETKAAIEDGAQEIDMVINVGALKDKKYDYVKNDIHTLKEVCGSDIVLKVIIETCLLTDEEKVKACELAKEAGADFVKTSTGFSTGGAKAEDVALMRKTVGDDMGVKASGGIHTAEEAQAMIDAGASRLGTSASIAICS